LLTDRQTDRQIVLIGRQTSQGKLYLCVIKWFTAHVPFCK